MNERHVDDGPNVGRCPLHARRAATDFTNNGLF